MWRLCSVPCLISDCESMGGSNEFFDKFSVRYHISVIFKKLWEDPRHRQVIVRESRLVPVTRDSRGGLGRHDPPSNEVFEKERENYDCVRPCVT